MHACMEATGFYGEALAKYLHETGIKISVVNPARIKAYAFNELSRNKTDKSDAALIARFCRTHNPILWSPPSDAILQLREAYRGLRDLKEEKLKY